MDAAHAAGLKVAFSLKDVYFGTRWCPASITDRASEEVYFKKRVAEFKGHPALLAWCNYSSNLLLLVIPCPSLIDCS